MHNININVYSPWHKCRIYGLIFYTVISFYPFHLHSSFATAAAGQTFEKEFIQTKKLEMGAGVNVILKLFIITTNHTTNYKFSREKRVVSHELKCMEKKGIHAVLLFVLPLARL